MRARWCSVAGRRGIDEADLLGAILRRTTADRSRSQRLGGALLRDVGGTEGQARTSCAPGRRDDARRPSRVRKPPRARLQVGEPRVAVITGGATGIGAAIARKLAGQGWTCVLLGRREDPLSRLADEIGGEYEVCDVADRDAVERVAASVQERHPAVAMLVNNAGIPGRSNFLDVDPEKAEQLVRVNYLGSLWCARAFLPPLEAARDARIVNIVSVAGTVALGPYSASKHAQLALSRSLAAELRPLGIWVLTVNPGFVHTEGFPQDRLLRGRFGSLVVGPEYVADRILRALRRGRTEIFVPAWYRPAAWIQTAAPGALTRLRARRRTY